MSIRFPHPYPSERRALRVIHTPRPPRVTWASCLPLGEILVMAAFGLVLLLA